MAGVHLTHNGQMNTLRVSVDCHVVKINKSETVQRNYVTETNTYRAFYLSTHPSEKLVSALSGTRTHVSQITSRAC